MLERKSNHYLLLTVLTLMVLLSVRLLGGQARNNETRSKVSANPAAKAETEKRQASAIADAALAACTLGGGRGRFIAEPPSNGTG